MKIISVLFLTSVLGGGCVFARHSVQLEPVTVEPIHLTVDVKIDVNEQPSEYAEGEAPERDKRAPGEDLPPPYEAPKE